jgi:signal peptidase II
MSAEPLLPLSTYQPHRSPAALLRFVGTTVLGLAADMLVKVLSFRFLNADVTWAPDPTGGVPRVLVSSDTYRLIPHWLEFTCTGNQGAVFGIGQGHRWIFVIVSIAAIGVLSFFFSRSGRQRGYQILLGMLLAGVLGNLWDRLSLGYVRDMIHALPGWRWPGSWSLFGYPGFGREVFPYIFNVADCLLCVGVTALLIHSFFAVPHPANDPPAAAEVPG